MTGSHHHHHHHEVTDYNKVFAFGILLNVFYIVVEVGYGYYINSLALLADAGHNFADVLGLLIAWLGHYLSRFRPSKRFTYGFKGASSLAALINAVLLLIAIVFIYWEAIQRFSEPVDIPGETVMLIAGIGVIINTLTALLFMRGRHEDLNLNGAFLHMAADALISLAVVAGGLITYLYAINWIDPLLSLIVATVILIGTWGLFKESIVLTLQGVPRGIDLDEVQKYFEELEPVKSIHQLHVWGVSTTDNAMSVHLVVHEDCHSDELIHQINHALEDQFKIKQSTIQIEHSPCDEHDHDGHDHGE